MKSNYPFSVPGDVVIVICDIVLQNVNVIGIFGNVECIDADVVLVDVDITLNRNHDEVHT